MDTIGYIIESDDNIRLEYIESNNEPYFQPEWVNGVNSFTNIQTVDPDDYNTPNLVRIGTANNYSYYYKTLIVPWEETSVRISVVVDNIEGSNSFTYNSYSDFLKTKKVGSVIYGTIYTNKRNSSRETLINIRKSSNADTTTDIRIKQEPCDIRIGLLSCTIKDGDSETTIPIENNNSFEYQFDTLTDVDDVKMQTLVFDVLATGNTNRFYVKEVAEYVSEGEIDDTYKYIDGFFYKNMLGVVNGVYVTKYAKVMVVDNIAYRRVPYDKAFEINVKNNHTLEIINYGRVYMFGEVFYVVKLANYDDINVTYDIKLSLKNAPDNSALFL